MVSLSKVRVETISAMESTHRFRDGCSSNVSSSFWRIVQRLSTVKPCPEGLCVGVLGKTHGVQSTAGAFLGVENVVLMFKSS
jgi:hypothetical protein